MLLLVAQVIGRLAKTDDGEFYRGHALQVRGHVDEGGHILRERVIPGHMGDQADASAC